MIPYGRQHIDDRDIQAVVDVLKSGSLTQGHFVDDFEAAIARRVGVKHAVAMSSGTAALHLAAIAAGIKPGNALLTSPLTFVATANAALYAGGSVAFADVDPRTLNIDPDRVAQVLRTRKDVRVVSPVHFGGLPCDMPAIKTAADKAGAMVIEDGAHALGATYEDGSPVGNCRYSAMTMFSFHPVKAIAAGEGGMITTNDTSLYRRLLRLRSHGVNKLDDPLCLPAQGETEGERHPWYYEMQELGFHYRITDIQCGLALAQLARLDEFLKRRHALVRQYDREFASFKNCRPAQGNRDHSAHHIYILRIDFDAIGRTRAQLMRELRARGILTQVHYIPVPAHPHYRQLGHRPEDFPNADAYYREALTIPLYYDLSDDEQRTVLAHLRELVG